MIMCFNILLCIVLGVVKSIISFFSEGVQYYGILLISDIICAFFPPLYHIVF